MSKEILVLNGRIFHSQEKIARDRGIVPRSVARDRERGAAWLYYAGIVYLEPEEYDRFVLDTRSRRRNPARRPRRQLQHLPQTA